jgi:hypothetical protein
VGRRQAHRSRNHLVRDHIASNTDPDLNGVLVNALMLKCVALVATGRIRPKDVIGMTGSAMITFHTNPPAQRPPEVCPTCSALYAYHYEHQYTCPKGHTWDGSQVLTVGALR